MLNDEIIVPDRKGLRQFGLLLGFLLALIPGLFLPWVWNLEQLPNYYWVASGVVFLLWSLIAPVSLKHLFVIWMRIALIIGHVVNTIILAVVYFCVVTLMGIVVRLMGKDLLNRRLDTALESYRVSSRNPDKNHMERPY